ncbi:MAG: hypothetical protein A3K10_13420 [Bacteroidetes bacterium RIFCSPLOWO2_12_FULL_31_6]|nr:MAG: hypothetical protein A3K10_13420 [Bacteroidetes bacterium RIFCSPLOWO2_12_FULL_31_6]
MKNNYYTKLFYTINTFLVLVFGITPNLLIAQQDTIKSDSVMVLSIDSFISKDAMKAKVEYKARDSIRFDMKSQQIFLFGESEVHYEDLELKAEEIESDLDSNIVTARGKQDSTQKYFGEPYFKQGEKEFYAHEIKYNFNTKKGLISDVKTQEGEGYIHGQKIYKNPDNILYIRNGKYTTCNLAEPHYHFGATKLKIIPNDKIITGPADLFIESTPTPFAIPFGFFPNTPKQKSGIIIPMPGESEQLGFFMLNGGYYLYVNDHLDAEFTGDFYSKGSWGTKFNSNYNKRYKFNGRVETNYSVFTNSEKEFPDYSEKRDFFLRWRHNQDPKARPTTVFSANVNLGTSTNFTNNFNTTATDYLSTNFSSNISFTKRWDNKPFTLNVNASHNQNTLSKQVTVRLPEIAFNVARIYPFARKKSIGAQKFYEKIGLSYSMNFRNEVTAPDSLFNSYDKISGKIKNGIQHSIPISTSFKVLKYFTLNPAVNYSEIWYLKTIHKTWDTSQIANVRTDTINKFERGNTYSTSANLTTKLYGMYNFKGDGIKAIRHVITPSVGLSYTPENNSGIRTYTDTNNISYKYSIFQEGVYGTAHTAKTGMLNFNLLQSFDMKYKSKKDTANTLKKVTLLDNLSLATSYNMLADSFNWSNISIGARTNLFNKFNINFNGTIDPYALDTGGTRLNKSHYSETGGLGRLTSASVNLGFMLKSKVAKKVEKTTKFATEQELAYVNSHLDDYIDFDVPWSLNFAYNVYYSKPVFESSKSVVQTIGVTGDVSLTQKWKIGFASGYDFQQHDLSYTSLNIYRDLHCWEMDIQWIPLGPRQSYTFTIKVKSAMLQDLKLIRRNIPSLF